MNIRNCRMCGHIFNYVAGPILCPHCREKMEAKFQEVKEYIRANPGVGIQDVAVERRKLCAELLVIMEHVR